MPKCPFCASENTQSLPSSEGIHKNYSKETSQGMVRCTETGAYFYPIVKEICMDCGYVFQKMSDDNLKKYHKEKQFFTN